MSRRRILERHRRSLAEIRSILNSMKTLAYMETRKLGRFLDAQNVVVEDIRTAAADLLSFYPYTLPQSEAANELILLIGTERGFCGDLNHSMLGHLDATLGARTDRKTRLMVIGRKLYTLLEGDERIVASIDGASVAEEVPAVLDQLVLEINALQTKLGPIDVSCLYQDDQGNVELESLLPPFREFAGAKATFAHPPLLNVSPAELLMEVADQYLFAALHAMLYNSLMAENHRRVSHLERAVDRLDEQSEQMAQQSNKLRQEEIIEEIEVILLSTASLGGNPLMPEPGTAPAAAGGRGPDR